ncbi:MAG: WecB/TagA/CpsF family glycosyltransferase [Patescibacteria group bacterium]
MKRETVKILGIKLDSITTAEAVSKLGEFMDSGKPNLLTTPNTEFLIAAQSDLEFMDLLNNKSKLNLPDSYGVIWAAKFLSMKTVKIPLIREIIIIFEWLLSVFLLPIFARSYLGPLKEKISGSDFIWDISRFAAKNKFKIFLLGGAPTVAERVALRLQTDIYGLKIAGVNSGTPKESEEIIAAINKSRADMILVAFGAPKQEKWLAANLKRTCCKIGIGLGGSFDFIAGTRQRAPRWMQKTGLEWLFRLAVEPSRIKRQFSIPKLMWLVLKEKLQG